MDHPDLQQDGVELAALARALRGRLRMIVTVGIVAAGLTAAWLAIEDDEFRGVTVLVPVGGQRASVSLPGVASLLGGTLQLGSAGFEATQDVVAYLLRSRTVLLAAATVPSGGRTAGEAVAGLAVTPATEEEVVRRLRREVRVTQAKETGFVTITVENTDSAAVRALMDAVVRASQDLFTRVARTQAHQLLIAQERRLDSASARLDRAEASLIAFDEGNRAVPPRSRLAVQRARLERIVNEAIQVHQLVEADRQAAIARDLEDAPALAVVEGLPPVFAPLPKRLPFRSALLGLSAMALLALLLATVELIRGASRDAA